MHIRESVRRWLHWQYTGWAIAIAISLCFVMIQLHHFVLAYVFLAVAAELAVASWWYSNTLMKRLSSLNKLKKKQDPEKPKTIAKYEHEFRKYRVLKWSVVSLLLFMTVSGLNFVRTEQRDFELSQLEGFLYPLNLPDPPSFCTSEANIGVIKIFLGRNEVYTSLSHYVILRVDDKDRMVIDRDGRGRIALSLDILDEQGKVIVTFEHGHFTVAQSNILDVRRPNRGTILVRDQFKNEVLNASYLNQTSLVVSALLRYPGSNPIRIEKTSKIDGMCLGNVGSVAIGIKTKP